MSKLTQDIYKQIYNETINRLKEDIILKRQFSQEQVKFIEQNWNKKLEERNIFLQTQADFSQFFSKYQKSTLLNKSQTFSVPVKKIKKEELSQEIYQSEPEVFSSIDKQQEFDKEEKLDQIDQDFHQEQNSVKKEPSVLEKRKMSNLDDFDAFFDDEEIPLNQKTKTEQHRDMNRLEMKAQIETALQVDSIDKPKQEEKENSYESLNSMDDLSEEDESVDTGHNILLSYYEKTTRKKNKRKIVLKYCILRIEDVDLIIPYAKGTFDWIAEHQLLN